MQSRVLARDTYELSIHPNKTPYKYEVELLVLNDLSGKHSVVNSKKYKEFVTQEMKIEKYRL